jgi:hypothetical protein
MTPLDTIRLLDIFFISIPIIAVSALLVLKTMQIRALQKRYNIQMVLFRNIMIVGYLLFAAGFFYLVEDAAEWYEQELVEELARVAFHLLVLSIAIAIAASLYHYYRLIALEAPKA